MKRLSHLRLCITPEAQCEVRSIDGEWRKAFLSVKGALDFVGTMEDAEVTITDGRHEMHLILPGHVAKPAMHRE